MLLVFYEMGEMSLDSIQSRELTSGFKLWLPHI